MPIRNSAADWGAVSKLFHWVTALLVIGMIAAGLIMVRIEDLTLKFQLYQWHKSFGFTVFVLSVARLGWRLVNPTPTMPAAMPSLERRLAEGAHILLYAHLAALPVSGWLMSAASPYGIPTIIFGWFALPHPIGPDPGAYKALVLTHQLLGWSLMAVLALHVAGALKHHFIVRDNVLRRMLPAFSRR